MPTRPRIFIGTNTLTMVEAAAYLSHMQMYFQMGRDFKEYDFILNTPRRASIDRMRNESAKLALQAECKYLMFIDDDVLTAPNTLKSLIRANKDIVMAETYIRGYPFEPMFFKNTGVNGNINLEPYRDFHKHVDPKTGLVSCDAVGFSCVLIKCELISKIPPPYFITTPNCTEDVFFCMKARQLLGDKVSIAVDTKVKTGHLLDREPITGDNVSAMRQFCEAAYPTLFNKSNFGDKNAKEDKSSRDRQANYFKENAPSKTVKTKSRVRTK